MMAPQIHKGQVWRVLSLSCWYRVEKVGEELIDCIHCEPNGAARKQAKPIALARDRFGFNRFHRPRSGREPLTYTGVWYVEGEAEK